jgi:hypothetical protein
MSITQDRDSELLTPRAVERLSAGEARRVALAAQGFLDPAPKGEPTRRHLARVFERVGLIQIDSVNVLARSHYLPVFARLGPYPMGLLEEAAWGRKRTLFEYWGHEASLIPVEQQPLFRWRMADAAAGVGLYGGLRRFREEKAGFVDAVLKEIGTRGPLSAGELSEGGKAEGSWWGWSDGKRALEWLFWAGLVTTATRRGFERVYDLPERALPIAVVETPTPSREESQRELIRIAARSMGVATERDLRDYFRMGVEDTRARLAELTDAGELEPVEVKGWAHAAWLAPEARRPRKIAAAALLSPFDSVVWRRERAERLFDFRYRLEIYTPAHKREHGYYVLPFLLGERIVGRVDLKADRKGGRLQVRATHLQPGVRVEEVAAPLVAELRSMAGWLGLADVAFDRSDPVDRAIEAVLG